MILASRCLHRLMPASIRSNQNIISSIVSLSGLLACSTVGGVWSHYPVSVRFFFLDWNETHECWRAS